MPERPELLIELLDRCRGGDARAVNRLVMRFYDYVHSLAVALVDDPHTAQDVTQDAMLTILTQLHTLRDPQAFPGWLRQIVRSHASQARRRGACHPAKPPPFAGDSPSDHVQFDELRRLIRGAIAQLSPANRQTAQLYYLDELDQARIARQLEIPIGTVKRRLHDARAKLRKLLDEHRPEADLPL